MGPLWLVVALFGCGETAPTAESCDLTVDNVVGKNFVMAVAQPQGPSVLNRQARLTFVEQDGAVKAKYTAMSLGDIYTYDCKKVEAEGKAPELECSEKERLSDWCEALYASDIKCTEKRLRKLGTEASEADVEAAIAVATANFKKAEADENPVVLQRWKAMRGGLGNKLQGQLFAKVDSRCRLQLNDMYWTLRNGDKVQDSNPVGTNPFIQMDEELLFEHCDNQSELMDMMVDAPPSAENPVVVEGKRHELDKPIFYYHGGTPTKAEEGCTYSIDTYGSWQPLQKGVAMTTNEEGNVLWRAEHTFTTTNAHKQDAKIFGVFHMARYKDCGGKKERISMSCRATPFN